MVRGKRLKKIRLHREGNPTLLWTLIALVALNMAVYQLSHDYYPWISTVLIVISVVLYLIIVNFFRCPIRVFDDETENTVVAPADGKVVVVEEVDEEEYFHERRMMVSIFMSLTNVHANWFPVEGVVRSVKHTNGNFHKAWLPKASSENERADVLIETPNGQMVLVRQVAGAMARRIVTYAHEDDHCYIDEHLGFIKFGSRVDVFLPLSAVVNVELGQSTVGNQTVIARLK